MRHERSEISQQLLAKSSSLLGHVAKEVDQDEEEWKEREEKIVRKLCRATKDVIINDSLCDTFEVAFLQGIVLATKAQSYLTSVPVRLQRVL